MGDLENRFGYHAPTSEDVARNHEWVRSLCLEVARQFASRVPDGREKSLAITKLEEAMFWANAGIARNQAAAPQEE